MSDLLMEADEALRQERIFKFWHEHRSLIITFIIFTILSTAAISAYRAWDKAKTEESTRNAMMVLNDEAFPDVITDDLPAIRPNLEAIVKLKAGGDYIAFQDLDSARAAYESVPDNAATELKTLSALLLSRLKGEKASSDVFDDDTPWHYYAHMDEALRLADQGKFKEARATLNIIREAKTLPPTLYQRAEALDMVFAVKAEQK